MLYFHLSRGSCEQNFDFFSLNNVTANLPIETGYKVIQEAEFKIPLLRNCSPGQINYSLSPNLMPEMCVGQEIGVTMITKNTFTATLKYCNGTQMHSCALGSEFQQSGSIAKSFIIQPRANMYTVEKNSPDKLEAAFPEKEMSLFLVSHSIRITLVWPQKWTKMQI